MALLPKPELCTQSYYAGALVRPHEDSSQNALWQYMHEYFVRRYFALAKEKLGVDTLNTQLAYSIRFTCMGAVGMTREWALNDNITSAETVVRMMFASMPENMRAAVLGE